MVYISPRETNRFFRGIKEAGIKADIQKIRRQLKSGYNVITVSDRFSPYTADLILVKSPPERKRGTVHGVKTYFQSPEALILAKLRMVKATVPRERSLKDRDDIRATLANTRVSKRKILDRARREGTIEILREILSSISAKRSFFDMGSGIDSFRQMTDHG
ncbi:MAG TPA: hypothetical protein VNA15_01970 [Candidatus Angelobacter sp.]|nr:hypothetical protein [Candidatus Angelobacter sp.]